MKKQKLLMLLVLLFAAGSSSAVTVITNQAELQAIPNGAAGDYVLGNDITLTGTFASIADFAGTFDGAFYVIDGLSTSGAADKSNGLYSSLTSDDVYPFGVVNHSFEYKFSYIRQDWIPSSGGFLQRVH